MRVTRHEKEVIQKEINIVICDFCTNYTEDQHQGYHGRIENCIACGKDCCKEHRKIFNWYYGDEYIVVCDDCKEMMALAVEYAEENTLHYESLEEVALRRFKEIKKHIIVFAYGSWDEFGHWHPNELLEMSADEQHEHNVINGYIK